MTNGGHGGGMSWSTRLLLALGLILAGAALTAWGLARYDSAARFLGVTPDPRPKVTAIASPGDGEPVADSIEAEAEVAADPEAAERRLAELEARLQQVENSAQRVEGSAGRADALLVAFAARRAIDRGVALGYLEPVILGRFGTSNPRSVATIVTGAQRPVRLNELVEEYRELEPVLLASGAKEGFWAGLSRELGSLVEIRRADRPSTLPEARYRRALTLLEDGEVDQALAETMRLPGAGEAEQWTGKAREYVIVHRALDEIESAALLGRVRRAAAQ